MLDRTVYAHVMQKTYKTHIGESGCNSGDGTDQRVQSLMFMMIMMMMMIKTRFNQFY